MLMHCFLVDHPWRADLTKFAPRENRGWPVGTAAGTLDISALSERMPSCGLGQRRFRRQGETDPS